MGDCPCKSDSFQTENCFLGKKIVTTLSVIWCNHRIKGHEVHLGYVACLALMLDSFANTSSVSMFLPEDDDGNLRSSPVI